MTIKKRIDGVRDTAVTITTTANSGTSVVEGTIKGDFYDPDLVLTFDDQQNPGTDSSGNSLNMTATDINIGVGSAPRDSYAIFNGVSSDMVLTSPTALNNEIGSDITVGFWFRSSTSDLTGKRVVNIRNDSSNYFNIIINNLNEITFLSVVGGVVQVDADIIQTYNDNTWRHYLVTMGTSVGGNVIYIDGVKQTPTYNTGSASVSTFITMSDANSTVYRLGNLDGNTQFYDGDLDDFFISGSFYSDGNVKSLYNATSISKTSTVIDDPNNLVVYGDIKVPNPCIITRNSTSTQLIPTNTLTLVEPGEVLSYEGITVNAGVFTLPEKGVYSFFGQFIINLNPNGIRLIQFRDGSGNIYGSSNQVNTGTGASSRLTTAGSVYYDGVGTFTLGMYAFQDSGTNLNITTIGGAEPVQVHIVKMC